LWISALLEHEDLLPADDSKACTAVCVKIVWNRDDNPACAFRARVIFIREENWRAELEALKKDIDDEENNRDLENGDPDVDRAERIKMALSKVRCVYPSIKTKKDMAMCTIDQLIEDPKVKAVLGATREIAEGDREVFAGKIRNYIDSNNTASGPAFAHWPLVKLVQLDVKSRILKDGLCLVDLPGSNDTNTARGEVASNFQRELAVSIVVAPAARASTDKPVSPLIVGELVAQSLTSF
jgi:hypothetical protein